MSVSSETLKSVACATFQHADCEHGGCECECHAQSVMQMTQSSFDTVSRVFGENLSATQKLDASKKAFLDSLSPRQFQSYDHVETFVVCTPQGICYAIASQGTISRQDQDEIYYLRIRGVNLWEELAIKKGWLEHAPQELLKRAVRLVFDTATPERERVDEERQLGTNFTDIPLIR